MKRIRFYNFHSFKIIFLEKLENTSLLPSHSFSDGPHALQANKSILDYSDGTGK